MTYAISDASSSLVWPYILKLATRRDAVEWSGVEL